MRLLALNRCPMVVLEVCFKCQISFVRKVIKSPLINQAFPSRYPTLTGITLNNIYKFSPILGAIDTLLVTQLFFQSFEVLLFFKRHLDLSIIFGCLYHFPAV